MAIDPSIHKIGIAVSDGLYDIVHAKTYYFKEKNIDRRMKQIFLTICLLIKKFKPDKVVIEVPGYPWVRYDKKTKRPVNLLPLKRLFIAIGLIQGAIFSSGKNYIRISPKEWKGNETKEITWFKFREMFPDKKLRISNDTVDAIMLGVYYRKKYLKEGKDGKKGN